MRRAILPALLAAACSADSTRQTDSWPVPLGRAPIAAGQPALGALLARTRIGDAEVPMVVDTAFPGTSVARLPCPNDAHSDWAYSGSFDLLDGGSTTPAPVRGMFRNVGLFDLCPGAVGDGTIAPSAVLGGSILIGYSLALTLPAAADAVPPASMTLWPWAPVESDDWFADQGKIALRFNLRGQVLLSNNQGDNTLTLPNTRVALGACIAPSAFDPTETQATCNKGEAAKSATGLDTIVVVGTGTGPFVIGENTYARLATQLGLPVDGGTPGELSTPLSSTPIPARFTTLPRLALFTGAPADPWLGPCAELGRARRIERTLVTPGACFQPCDANGKNAVATLPYLELGGGIPTAVVSETSPLFLSLNMDVPPGARVNGMIGAGTLAGTNIEIDYLSKPQGRFIIGCEPGRERNDCFAAPACPPLSKQGQRHRCFGLAPVGYQPICKP